MGNIEADTNGVAEFNLTDRMLSLSGSRSIIGRSIVIDYVEDDFDKHRGRERVDSKTAVFPAACGVIGMVDWNSSTVSIVYLYRWKKTV